MNQHAKVKIAILRSLKRMPKTYTMRDEALRAEVCLDVQPRPTLLELEDALTDLEQSSCIIGTRNDLTGERKWMITDAGILQLGQIRLSRMPLSPSPPWLSA